MVESHTEQLSNGLTPEQVKFSTSLPVLRNASVQPIVDLFNWSQGLLGKELIQRNVVLGLEDDVIAEAAAADEEDDDDEPFGDHTDVSLQQIVKESLGLDVAIVDLPGAKFCVAADSVTSGDDGNLRGDRGDAENIWAYNDNGLPWGAATWPALYVMFGKLGNILNTNYVGGEIQNPEKNIPRANCIDSIPSSARSTDEVKVIAWQGESIKLVFDPDPIQDSL
ncbi:hypothetical protein C8J57DRAFT_1231450 [Mycena rebaudengoi]|nr:hypothetical protein C8J57DRAFT_1231450 [Mycena rebaudengoi]